MLFARPPVLSAARVILDRFLHHAQTIAITGRSYRLKDQTQTKQEKITKKTPDESEKAAQD